jgi:hypothetical protein
LKKPFTKIGLVAWLKVKALSSNPSTAKKKKRERDLEYSGTQTFYDASTRRSGCWNFLFIIKSCFCSPADGSR